MQIRESKDEEERKKLEKSIKVHEHEKETLENELRFKEIFVDDNDVPSVEGILKLREQMYGLKHFGKRIKGICSMIEEQAKNRPPAIIPVPTSPNFRDTCSKPKKRQRSPINYAIDQDSLEPALSCFPMLHM